MTNNMHPADELHALRQQKSEIERRIKEARTLLLELARKVLLQRALRIAARAPMHQGSRAIYKGQVSLRDHPQADAENMGVSTIER
jgi:hypothetical protein